MFGQLFVKAFSLSCSMLSLSLRVVFVYAFNVAKIHCRCSMCACSCLLLFCWLCCYCFVDKMHAACSSIAFVVNWASTMWLPMVKGLFFRGTMLWEPKERIYVSVHVFGFKRRGQIFSLFVWAYILSSVGCNTRSALERFILSKEKPAKQQNKKKVHNFSLVVTHKC